jgi:hypothetical protein
VAWAGSASELGWRLHERVVGGEGTSAVAMGDAGTGMDEDGWLRGAMARALLERGLRARTAAGTAGASEDGGGDCGRGEGNRT